MRRLHTWRTTVPCAGSYTASCLLAPCQNELAKFINGIAHLCCTDEPVLVLGLSLDSWMCPRPVHIWFDHATRSAS